MAERREARMVPLGSAIQEQRLRAARREVGRSGRARRMRASAAKGSCRDMVRLTTAMTRKTAAALCVGLGLALCASVALADQPHPWQLGMQPPATPVTERIHAFHNELLVIISLISAFVIALLIYVMVRFNHRANPVPTRTSHNAVIEILWTVVPVLDPRRHCDPVVQADVLHGPGAQRGDDDQGHRASMVLAATNTPTRAISASTATSSTIRSGSRARSACSMSTTRWLSRSARMSGCRSPGPT